MRTLLLTIAVLMCLTATGCMSFRYEETLTRKRKVDYDNPLVELAKVFVGKKAHNRPIKTQSSWTPENMPEGFRGR